MNVECFLFVSNAGNIRVTKTATKPRPTEVRINVVIDVPKVLFERPTPVVKINVPDSLIPGPMQEIVAITSETVAESLNADVKAVQDGLWAAVRDHHEESESQP